MERSIFPNYIKAVYVLLLIGLIIFALIMGRSILLPLVLSAYIAMLLTPLCNWMENYRVPRIMSSLIALIISLTFIGLILFFIITQLTKFGNDLDNIEESINNYMLEIDSIIVEKTGFETQLDRGLDKDMIMGMISDNNGSITTFLLGTVDSLAGIILLPIFIFFLLLYRKKMTKFILKLFRSHNKDELLDKIVNLRQIIKSYILGMLKVIVILAVLNTTALLIIGIEHAIFFGCVAAMLNIIPFVGPFIAATLPILYAIFTMEGLVYPLAILAAFTVIQTAETHIFTPNLVGRNVDLNPLVTILGLLIGFSIWGPIGMVLIVPTLAIVAQIFKLNPDTEPYAYLFSAEE